MDQTKTHTNIKIHLPTEGNELLDKALEKVNRNEEVTTLWQVVNVNAIDRLGMTDHGPVHFQIVSNIAVRLVRLLVKSGIKMSITKDFGLSGKHAELVVLLASLFHDLGMSIQRDEHEEFSLFLANNLLHEIIDFLPVVQKTIVISESLHAIISHRSDGQPFTIEAGIVRVADALDMNQGRSRIPYEAGKVDIHSVSAMAIENVEIAMGKTKPVEISIHMNNSAGLFQVDELLKRKLIGSGIEKYIEVKAYVQGETEKKLLKEFTIK
ncbi:phosphohydrolase [Candidatus Gottesmanbacteria bacterium CG11_big_fil_rev_8_21_14_0_20_37_11]|uniref:Phosphohydrolase n=3 Tax=Candidatus Gottesmaniibacteriota TaxID=1752720 RepID=A0A2M7RPX3_9BACT|nr:MAG: phosphohydrolase [Candidatus Gottesmanbacteria bacterium CG1_02_37_22]PIP32974.1 MAG: phosphohydrolase [Candidatus Gottesmanbacteria bacterium CG23_combo_of_CG06-09_8_20_14_all_37_19]PIR07771.1 MAG: phosphohydrolase [Candidatus Gottesmanbacteria bacterium CG11_big_fil_rev_8_21_14_0_20_37_11]PIZ02368.1 MAG: phosphohydrolase [Candidatus Gottesmanbacteria bacterium CG_4_10_14_0_8_um_filter_37_24]